MINKINKKHISARFGKIEKNFLAKNKVRVLSTLEYPKSQFWNDFCETIDVSKVSGGRRVIKIFLSALKSNNYDRYFITGGKKSDLIALALLSFMPWISKKFVIIDGHWQKKLGLVGLVQKSILFCARRMILQVQVHSEEEAAIYPEIFSLSKHRMKAIPFSTSILGYDLKTSNDKFILSGGGSFRNYLPLITIASSLPMEVRLGIPEHFMPKFQYLSNEIPNVRIINHWTNKEYFQQMARCEIFLMPLEKNLNRTAADQTILNAMFLRKVVIINDSITARTYINNGVNGFVYDEDDPQSLLNIINQWQGATEQEKNKILNCAEYQANTKFSEEWRLLKTAIYGVKGNLV